MKKLALTALIAGALLGGTALISPYALAQAPAPGAAQADQARPMRMMGDRIEARIAYIKTALKITPAQERQWNTVAEVMRKQAKAFDDARQAQRAAGNQPASAIERLQQRQQHMTLASASLNELIAAAQPLYAGFSDEQKKIADEMLDRRGHRGSHGGRHHRSH